MSGEAQFTEVLEKIYSAALSEDFWPEALRAVGAMFDSPFAHFEVIDKGSGAPVFFRNEGADDAYLKPYVDYFSTISPRVAAGKLMPAGAVTCDYDILTEAQIDRDEYYTDFMMPQGYRYFLSANLINDDRLFSVFSVQRPTGQGHASDADVALMRKLAPHLSRAMQVHLRLTASAANGRTGDLLFETSTRGVVYLDSRGAVLSLNPAARRMISNPANRMDVRRGHLAIGAPGDSERIDKLIARALATGAGAGFEAAAGTTVARADGMPLSVVAVPLPNGGPLAALIGAPVVALLVADPDLRADLPDTLLRALYGFTPAECGVATALLSGQSPAEYADRAGIGIRTVRTHLSRILGKTGARNQVALVRLLGGLR
tara:strand:+ start:110 stop:1231 length:1122 start_codon:yes stop_codon:yes gene_type:complete